MGYSRELKAEVDGLAQDLRNGAQHIAGEVRETLGNAKEKVVEGAEDLETALADVSDEAGVEEGRRPSWKLVLGAVAGLALIGAAVIVARRRGHSGNLLQRGIREGSKYAVLIPIGLQKARDSVEHLSHEAAHQWDKLPRLQIKVK